MVERTDAFEGRGRTGRCVKEERVRRGGRKAERMRKKERMARKESV